jgi:hypothetical protein
MQTMMTTHESSDESSRPSRDGAPAALPKLSWSGSLWGWLALAIAASRWRALAMVLGAGASLGCIPPDQGYRTQAYLVNAGEPVEVHLFRVHGPLDCAALAANPSSAIDGAAFDPGLCAKLNPARVMPLDRGWISTMNYGQGPPEPDGIAGTGPQPRCDAVIVRAQGLRDTLLAWNGLEAVDTLDPPQLGSAQPHAVYLESVGDDRYLGRSPLVQAAPVPPFGPQLLDFICSAYALPPHQSEAETAGP